LCDGAFWPLAEAFSTNGGSQNARAVIDLRFRVSNDACRSWSD
jgi:hypothetical protein